MITTESISKTKEGKLYSSLAAIVSDRERYIEKVEDFLQFEFLLYDSFFLRTYGGERLRSLWEHCEQHPDSTKGVLESELLLTNGFPMYLGFDLSKKMSHHFCGFPGSGSNGLGFKQFVFNQKTENFELLDSVPEEENSPYIVMGELFPKLSPETLLGIVKYYDCSKVGFYELAEMFAEDLEKLIKIGLLK